MFWFFACLRNKFAIFHTQYNGWQNEKKNRHQKKQCFESVWRPCVEFCSRYLVQWLNWHESKRSLPCHGTDKPMEFRVCTHMWKLLRTCNKKTVPLSKFTVSFLYMPRGFSSDHNIKLASSLRLQACMLWFKWQNTKWW